MGCTGSKNTSSSVASPRPADRTLLAAETLPKIPGNLTAQSNSELPAAQRAEGPGVAAYPDGTASAGTRGVNSCGLMRKQGTMCSDRCELDVMVSQFTSHDSTLANAMGRTCKHLKWKVLFAIDAAPIEIALDVQEHKLHYHEVGIECNGEPILHGVGSHTKGRMLEDFSYQWPFRATIKGINELNYFELRPSHNTETWYPATITSQRHDGFFEVSALQPDAYGCPRAVQYPAVAKTDLREVNSGKPLVVPESSLMLHVPKHAPHDAVLSVSGEAVTHHFGRPSPQRGVRSKIDLQVSRDRSTVTANVGHSLLSLFTSGAARSVNCDVERLKHSWTVQFGPFAEHTVKILKKYTLGKIITLEVDGEVFIEATAADIGCKGTEWRCDFHFIGENILDFEVFKTNRDGVALDGTDHVLERRRYVHKCAVIIPNDWDLSTAQFVIDGCNFRDLHVKPLSEPQESALSMNPTAMLQSYGITVPYKVDHSAPSGIASMAHSILATAQTSRKSASSFLSWCYEPSVMPDSELPAIVERHDNDGICA